MKHLQTLFPWFDSFLLPVQDGTFGLRSWYESHYSARRYRDGRRPRKIVGPGEYEIFVSSDLGALLIFRKSIRAISGCHGVYLSCFRREPWCRYRASDLLREAVRLAQLRWPGETFFTFVDPRKVRGTCPGYCFRRAGWRCIGHTRRGLLILELRSNKSRCHHRGTR